ncbi:macro domain-containing protein [Robertmurraya korlensis]|uniref:macro domain-containing protein n=1 Tax=Robertmurraya korlensis TaxID=519977 RepID=UPI0020411150|nr:macro domain-containing protein [Robertmurraya korlensis]MCM3603110.1 macro domain-containing protein [Robertmurraya korlensis]
MIEYIKGTIPYIKGDILVNAANGRGWMGGILGRFIKLNGVAESIHYADPSIEKITKALFRRNKARSGDVIHTTSGKLFYPEGILHAVTMNWPGTKSSIDTVNQCLDNILVYCNENNIETVVIPLLGTGTGRLNKNTVLALYKEKLQKSNTIFKVVLVQ